MSEEENIEVLEDEFSLQVDSNFLQKFYKLAGLNMPEDVALENLYEVLNTLESKLGVTTSGSKSVDENKTNALLNELKQQTQSTEATSVERPKTVLIVDDLGVITFQLDSLFKRLGFETVISREINDAIDKFKKQDFGYAVVDLFIPTDREGFMLLDELKKLSLLCGLNTMIIVMTASSKEEYRTKSLNRGADYYVEKISGWQDELAKVCS